MVDRPTLATEQMPTVGTIEDRYQSYNVEMVEVIGGRFWKPYDAEPDSARTEQPAAQTPVGVDPSLYQYRPPADLTDRRLRTLAAALGPAYIRVSGTWANTVYFHDSDSPPPADPPAGFSGVLTRAEWRGVVDFARAVDARIITSVTTSDGVRDDEGVWTPDQARRLLEYTTSVGGAVAATEFMNEPTFAAMGGAPKGYDAAAFGRDVRVFDSFLRQAAPQTLFLGPGSVGEGGPEPISLGDTPTLDSADLLAATGPVFDAFSYHYYGAVSQRGASLGATQTTAAAALSEDWLTRTDQVEDFYAGLRDRFLPGWPLWVTETAESAAGGNPWASTFLDTFRYLYQLGSLARRGVQVIAHNTLAASDYALLDQNTFEPRPSYWAALLWRRLMGTTVLDPGSSSSGLYVFAHGRRDDPSGVALLVLNTTQESRSLQLTSDAERFTLSAPDQPQSRTVLLNGQELALGPDDALPPLTGTHVAAGAVTFDPTTITFLAM